MDELHFIAILEMSAGNESVGEMWQETKLFKFDTPISDVLRWAADKHNRNNQPENFRGKLTITVAQ